MEEFENPPLAIDEEAPDEDEENDEEEEQGEEEGGLELDQQQVLLSFVIHALYIYSRISLLNQFQMNSLQPRIQFLSVWVFNTDPSIKPWSVLGVDVVLERDGRST